EDAANHCKYQRIQFTSYCQNFVKVVQFSNTAYLLTVSQLLVDATQLAESSSMSPSTKSGDWLTRAALSLVSSFSMPLEGAQAQDSDLCCSRDSLLIMARNPSSISASTQAHNYRLQSWSPT